MKYQFLLLLPLFAVGACSGGNDTAPPATSNAGTATQTKPAENQFMKAQIETLGQAKDASSAANEAIIKRQQALEAAGQ